MLIKSSDTSNLAEIRSLGEVLSPKIVSSSAEQLTEEKNVVTSPVSLAADEKVFVELKAEVSRLEEEMRVKEVEYTVNLEEAVEEAHKLGLEEAEAAHKEYRAAIDTALEKAQNSFSERLDKLDQTAVGIALASLDNVFGHSPYREQVSKAIRHQIGSLRRESVLSIQVSNKDFSSADISSYLTEALQSQFQGNIVLADLPAGTAELDLQLGKLEIDLQRYFQDLQNTLHPEQSKTDTGVT